ncbi:MAG: PAS domain S-box protein [Bacteroidota bacterium]
METPHSTSTIQPLATVLQHAPAIIYLYDIQRNTNTYANRSLSDFLGYSPQDVQSMGDRFLLETIHPNDLNRILAHHSEVLPALHDGETISLQYRIKHKRKNKYVWLQSIESVYERDSRDDVKIIHGIATDITKEKEAEKHAASEKYKHLEILLNLSQQNYNSQEEILKAYLDTGCRLMRMETGIVSVVKDSSYKILGIQSPHKDWKTGMVFCLDDTLCEAVMTQNRPIYYHDMVLSEMQDHPLYKSGSVNSYIGTKIILGEGLVGTLNFSSRFSQEIPKDDNQLTFISLLANGLSHLLQLNTAQEELQKSKIQYQNLYHTAPDMMISSGPDGKMIKCNQTTLEKLGYTEDELLKKNLIELIPASQKSSLEELIEISRKADNISNFELQPESKTGALIDIELNSSWIKDAAGNFSHSNAIMRDISETVELKKELEQFVYSVSHDLRAPVRHIEGYTSWILEDKDSLSASSQDYLNKVIEASKRLGGMIDALLTYSRNRNVEPTAENFDMKALILEVAENFKSKKNESQIIHFHMGSLPTEVNGDLQMFRTVWENLIGNALKYSSKKHESHIEISSQESENEITFRIKDNGVGFENAYSNKLFAVFQRLHPRSEFKGNGIGLANVKRIISSHGGKIWAKGELDLGAEFCFSLPK